MGDLRLCHKRDWVTHLQTDWTEGQDTYDLENYEQPVVTDLKHKRSDFKTDLKLWKMEV